MIFRIYQLTEKGKKWIVANAETKEAAEEIIKAQRDPEQFEIVEADSPGELESFPFPTEKQLMIFKYLETKYSRLPMIAPEGSDKLRVQIDGHSTTLGVDFMANIRDIDRGGVIIAEANINLNKAIGEIEAPEAWKDTKDWALPGLKEPETIANDLAAKAKRFKKEVERICDETIDY